MTEENWVIVSYLEDHWLGAVLELEIRYYEVDLSISGIVLKKKKKNDSVRF